MSRCSPAAAADRLLEVARGRLRVCPAASSMNASSQQRLERERVLPAAARAREAARSYLPSSAASWRTVIRRARADRLQRRPARRERGHRARRPRPRRPAAPGAARTRRPPPVATRRAHGPGTQRGRPGHPAGAPAAPRPRCPGTNHVQSISECSAEDHHQRRHRQQPDPLGVERQPAVAAAQPGRARRREHPRQRGEQRQRRARSARGRPASGSRSRGRGARSSRSVR